MRICDHCGGEVIEKIYTMGDSVDGFSICLECDVVEGPYHEEE